MTTHRLLLGLTFLLTTVAAHAEKRRAVAPKVPLERVLVPFMAEFLPDPPNAWATEFIVHNDGTEDLAIVYERPCIIGTPPTNTDPCAARVERLPPRRLTILQAAEDASGGIPQPVVGTELPLVREDQFTTRVHLLNVPSVGGPGVRKILRVYADGITPFTVQIAVNAVDHSAERFLTQIVTTLDPGRTSGDFEVVPAWAVIDLTPWIESHLPEIPQARVTVDIRSTHKFWAFITILNDQSHQWTNITADR